MTFWIRWQGAGGPQGPPIGEYATRDEAEAARLDSVLYSLAEGLRVVSLLLVPFMPEATERLLRALGQDDLSLANARFGSVGGGARCGPLDPLFPRIEAVAQS